MVMQIAGTVAANEASRTRDNGESIVSTAFKFGILAIAVLAFVAVLVGLWLFNNWAGIIDFGGSLLGWISDRIGGFWGGATGLLPALGSWLFASPTQGIKKNLSTVRGVYPSDIV